MAVTFDGTIEQVDSTTYKHRGGTVNTTSATLSICLSFLDPGAYVEIRFKVKSQNGKIYFLNEENPVTKATIPLTKKIIEFTDPCAFTYPVHYDKTDSEVYYEVIIYGGDAGVELNSQLDSST